jgi:flagellar hook-basal body complex protein FliE
VDLNTCEQISSFVEQLDKELESINTGQTNVPTEFSAVLDQAVNNINKTQGENKPNVTKESLALAFRSIRSDNFSKFLAS